MIVAAFILILPLLDGNIGLSGYSSEFVPNPSYDRPDDNLHPQLGRVLEESASDELVEAVVSFADTLTADDRAMVVDLGLEWIADMNSFPVALVRGTPNQVRELSQYSRVVWMEHNFEVMPMMHTTTMVIEASSAWSSRTIDVVNHEIEGVLNSQSMATGIDGRGVAVAVVDTGIDAAHPDFDYGEKVLLNLKCDMEVEGECVWMEKENTDDTYGHGTHCAGTIAGNGDASAGARRGVAPGASLIGVGGDWTPVYWSVGAGLEWVFDNSRPGQNPYNIRAVSNSWGQGGNSEVYFPDDMLTQVIERLVYENNVVVVFAAGNDGGDGSTLETNPWSLIPASISVAAANRNGNGLAGFSSRGQHDIMASWPDVATPGVDIWATAARLTFIDALTSDQGDVYYYYISGTSMATPHMSGIVALMSQAAPSLRTSAILEDFDENWVHPVDESRRRIHEAELILKLTSDYITPNGNNGIPEGNWTGLDDRPLDFGQGYGLANASHAVGLALTLQAIRDHHYSQATVYDAYEQYQRIMGADYREANTDRLGTSWRGEWTQITNNSSPTSGTDVYETDQSHFLYIPEGAESADITFRYEAVNVNSQTASDVNLELDVDGDGINDLDHQHGSASGTKQYHIDITDPGRVWTFNVRGTGVTLDLDLTDKYPEARAEYSVDMTLNLAQGTEVDIDNFYTKSRHGQWEPAEPSQATTTTISIIRPTYNLSQIDFSQIPKEDQDDDMISFGPISLGKNGIIMLVFATTVIGFLIGLNWRREEEVEQAVRLKETLDAPGEDEVLEAEQ